MRTVLFVESGITAGGSSESLYQHLRVLDRTRYKPIVVYLNNMHYVDQIRDLGVPVFVLTDPVLSRGASRLASLPLRLALKIADGVSGEAYFRVRRIAHRGLVRAVVSLIRRERIDIIHLNVSPKRDLFGILAAKEANIPCVSHLRSVDQDAFDAPAVTVANNVVSTYVANSAVTAKHWERLGLDSSKTVVVHNGIAESHFEASSLDIRDVWGIGTDVEQVVACVARFISWKGHAFLLRAFARVARDRGNVCLLLVGEGPTRAEMEALAVSLGIRDRVLFAGFDERGTQIIAAADLLVVPSRNEPFGRVVLEAMQSGTPVVAAASGGVVEIIEHDWNGLLTPLDDDAALGAAMVRVLDDPALRERFVANGLKAVKERFSIENYAEQMSAIYDRCLASASVGPDAASADLAERGQSK